MAYPTAGPMDQLPDAFSQGFSVPPPVPGGMFGGGSKLQAALMAAVAGYNARLRPGMSQAMMGMIQQRQQAALEEKMYEHRADLEMQRQMTMLPIEAQLKLMYPDNAFAQEAYQSGIRPGTPEWSKAMQTRVQNELDPAVLTPQGMMLRSQITGALQPPAAPVGKLTPLGAGGQASPAPGAFPGY